MTEHEQLILAVFFNSVILLAMLISCLWVGLDARKNGHTTAEYVTWGIFAGCLLIVGPIIYYIFKSKIYK